MAWCHQAGGHYLNQCWPSSMTQYGIPWPQSRCVNRCWWNFQDGSEIIQGTNVLMGMDHHLDPYCGWGLGAFLRWWPPSTMWAGSLIYLWPPRGCLNNPIFSNLGLCAACWPHFMCHHELWPTLVSHPVSLNSSLGFAGGKHYQKINIPIFRLPNFAISGCFPHILFYCYIFSLFSSGWFVIAVCGSISVQGTS